MGGVTARVAVVTGAASGLGRAAAVRLCAAGWRVAAVDLRRADLEDVVAAGATPFECDVTDSDAVVATCADIVSRLGSVDRLVNAAGIAVPGRVEDVSIDDYARSMDVNYLGSVRWVRELLPGMRQRRAGELVLFASFAGFLPTPGMAAYTSTKFAVVGFAETLSMELRGSGIRVHCVCPPAVRTPMLDGILAHQSASRFASIVRPISVDAVLDGLDAALRSGRRSVFVFPDLSTKVMWRLRRAAPGPLRLAAGVLLAPKSTNSQ